ncbi:MAG: 3-dehydroquinate synthase [Gammaproteobacteria bacterium]|nr:3-dehydroquinate synthase [Gammaproteobacteria bacterium]
MSSPSESIHVIETAPHVYRQRFSVPTDYSVWFSRDVFSVRNPLLARSLSEGVPERPHRVCVLIDAGVAAAWALLGEMIQCYAHHHSTRMLLACPPEIVPGGEDCKNDPGLVTRLQQRLVDLKIDRHSFVIAIGGGAFLDLAGYVAATTHRGIRLIRMPTTVLAQDDSAIGVKNGVNAFGMKNLLGTFAPPYAVISDFCFLRTLSARDRVAGMAEAVKVASIRDRDFFAWMESNAARLRAFDDAAVEHLIRRCAELHMQHIAGGGDPFETGSARPLDYGHWAAHKLESLSQHDVRHGEAVAIGMSLDARYAELTGLLPAAHVERLVSLLSALGFALWHPALEMRCNGAGLALLAGLQEFREHLGGQLTVTMLTAIGSARDVHEIDHRRMQQAVEWLKLRSAGG